jgi:hypothetical protein
MEDIMPQLLYVPISDAARREIYQRSIRERRRMQDEAALIIERALGLDSAQSAAEFEVPARELPTDVTGR